MHSFLRLVMSSTAPSMDLRMAYHGTRLASNAASIFAKGLDPACRSGRLRGAYLATQHATSMGYVGNAGALMLFVLVSVTTLAMQYPPSMCEGVYIVPERIALPVAQLCS